MVPTIPKALVDLGAGVILVFIVLLIISQIVKLVGLLKGAKSANGNHGGGRIPCVQAPVVQTMTVNQAVIMETMRRMEATNARISETIVLQTSLMERSLELSEKFGDLLAKMSAREEARRDAGR